MPALFTLPKAVPLSSGGLLLPGAKLTFTQTGGTTPQNTYQDILLTTPHANPVVADAAGVFAPIYLDAALPNYRVKLTTSADVLVWQVDDYPSNQNTAQTFRLSAPAPELVFHETDASANNGKIRLRIQTEVFSIALLNDAESVATSVLDLGRSGTTLGTLTFLSGTTGAVSFLPSASGNFDVLASGTGLLRYKSVEVATTQVGTFTGTFTGFSSAQTAQCQFHLIGSPGAAATKIITFPSFAATSNATTMTLTGLPASIAANTGMVQTLLVKDSGTDAVGNARIVSGSPQVVTFGVSAASGGFTASGSKGFPGEYTQLVYK